MMSIVEEYLEQIPMWAVRKNSLADIRAYMEELGNPDDSMKIIHVAGTNGKGSVCAFLTSVLSEAGYTVGTFVSPHLEETRERFLFNGEMVGIKEYENAFGKVKKLSETMQQKGFAPPTYFEFLFYMSMVINASLRPDFVILETGLGGRLDATNVIRHPAAVIITSVSMDHMEYLGNTIEEIAWEKAGIMKQGAPVIYDDNYPEVSAVIRRRAGELGCRVYPVSRKDYSVMERGEEYTRMSVKNADGGQLVLEVPTIADYQLMNVVVAIQAIGILRKCMSCYIASGDIMVGIRRSYWPGRMEQVLPGIYLDGAHNAGGIDALARTIIMLERETGKKVHLLFAAVSDKEYGRMIGRLGKEVELASVSIAKLKTERGMDPEILEQEFKKLTGCPVETFSSAEEAFAHVLAVKKDDFAFCVGSLYLIGEIKQLLARRKEHD